MTGPELFDASGRREAWVDRRLRLRRTRSWTSRRHLRDSRRVDTLVDLRKEGTR